MVGGIGELEAAAASVTPSRPIQNFFDQKGEAGLSRLMWAGLYQSEDNYSTYPTFTMMNAASFATGGFGIDRLLRQHPLATRRSGQ
jgi:hypothetical protein